MKNLLPIVILIFFACDPAVNNKFIIENSSYSDIRIESILEYGNRSMTENDTFKLVKLKPKTESVITEFTQIGNAYDKRIDFLNGIDTIVVNIENRILTKNIYDRNNWEYRVLNSGLFSMDEVEYRFKLTEADIE